MHLQGKGRYEYVLMYAGEEKCNNLGCKLCSLCAAANSQRGLREESEVVGGEMLLVLRNVELRVIQGQSRRTTVTIHSCVFCQPEKMSLTK